MYIPHSQQDIEFLLKECGLKNRDEIFKHIPYYDKYKIDSINIPKLSEKEILEYFQECAKANIDMQNKKIFLGGGVYYHYIPSVVDYLSARGEFVTSYTPYQPEASQGSLQAFYDFQTLIGRLTGYKAVTLGHYDGATALSEIIAIFARLKETDTIALSPFLNPYVKNVVKTYTGILRLNTIELPQSARYTVDINALNEFIEKNRTKILVVQQPNFYGFLEDTKAVAEIAKKRNVLSVYFSLEPTHLGLFRCPGELGYDITVLEGQPLGIYPNFGGPLLGIIASKEEYLRYLPGRLVGKTYDAENKVAYTLTLQTREQHIRREKSFSNICTNQGVLAIRVAIYLASLGFEGLRKIASICYDYAHYAYENILKNANIRKMSDADFYNEFTIKTLFDPQQLNNKLIAKNMVGGLSIKNGNDYIYIVALTELLDKKSIDEFINTLLD
ncbi:MAG: aminomethyl-transferring glycine dehydrogenase subunit GcvPA [Planctomycetota bacterium]